MSFAGPSSLSGIIFFEERLRSAPFKDDSESEALDKILATSRADVDFADLLWGVLYR